MKRHPILILSLLLASVIGSFVQAQTAPWNVNDVAWDAPTSCTSGQPISSCPITGYQILRSATPTGTYTAVGTSTTTTFTHLVTVGGQSCYKIVAQSAQGDSVPSVTPACRTNVQPSGPPNPPTNVRLTVAVVAGDVRTPIFSVAGSAPNYTVGTYFGSIPVGSQCGDYLFTYRKVKFHRVVPEKSQLWGRTDVRGLAAACG